MVSRILAGWVALGVALTGATQLRMAGLPLGPGEALLAVWLAFFAFCLLRNVPFNYSDAFRPFAIYWSISAVLLTAGSLVAIVLDKQDGSSAGHDALAFAFVGPLTCALAIRVGDVTNEHYYLSLARATFFAISAVGLVLLTASLVTSHWGPIDLWYGGGTRFRGWAENPNQLAMFMVPMPFLGAYLLREAHGFGRKLVYLLAIGPCAMVGLMTDSDSLRVTWVGAALVVAVWLWYRLMFRGRGQFLYVSHVIVPIVGLTVAVALGDQLVARFMEIAEQIYEKGERGHIGIMVLMNGLEAVSQSPVVGWGPGAYSGIHRPFDSFEAHNTIVDWGMSTGVLGMALYLGLLLWCTVRAIRSGSPWLLGTLVAIVSDSMFGYSMRHPFFWLIVVLVATLSERTARQRAVQPSLPQQPALRASEQPVYSLSKRRARRESSAPATRLP